MHDSLNIIFTLLYFQLYICIVSELPAVYNAMFLYVLYVSAHMYACACAHCVLSQFQGQDKLHNCCCVAEVILLNHAKIPAKCVVHVCIHEQWNLLGHISN